MKSNLVPPRENLIRGVYALPATSRSSGQVQRAVQVPSDGRTLQLQWSVTGIWTEIDSWYEGHFMECIAPGAAEKTIAENKANMRILLQHGRDPSIGEKPIAPIDLVEENDLGGYAEGRLFDGLDPLVVDGLRAGQYGASFRFRVLRDELVQDPEPSDYNPRGIPERTIKEMAVSEFGPVTWGAYPEASAGVRSLTDVLHQRAGTAKARPTRTLTPQTTTAKKTARFEGEIPLPPWALRTELELPAGEHVELREKATSPLKVRLGALARADILEDAGITPRHERGAVLAGLRRNGVINIMAANVTGITTRSGRGAIAFDFGTEFVWVRRQREIHGPHVGLSGDWHSHPDGGLIPSEGDLRAWSSIMQAGEGIGPTSSHAGLIVAPSVRGWGYDIAAWVIRRQERWPNRLVCERAEIIS